MNAGISTADLIGIVLASGGALILGMAALIKTMILRKWDLDRDDAKRDRHDMQDALKDIKESQKKLLEGQEELKSEMHDMDVRITRLETEHRLHACIYGRVPEDTQPGTTLYQNGSR